jgi:hypothetical protein
MKEKADWVEAKDFETNALVYQEPDDCSSIGT